MKHLFKAALQVFSLAVFFTLCAYEGMAQTHWPQTTTETSVVSPGNVPTWMNNAIFRNDDGTVYGEVWDEGTGNGIYLEVHDNIGGGSTGAVQLGTTLLANGYCEHPDVVIGGDATHMYVAAVYTYQRTTAPVGNNIFMEVYTITGIGTGITLNSCTTYIFPVTGQNADHVGDAHIDLANEGYGAASVRADTFVIAWEEKTTCGIGLNFGARGATGALSRFAGSTCSVASFTYSNGCFNNVGNGDRGDQVDIAVRYIPASGTCVALFTYDDLSNGDIFLGAWNVTGNSVTTGTVLDNTPGTGNSEYPRIDVRDQNASTTPNCAAYDVVYRYYDGTAWNVNQINDILGNSNPETITAQYAGTNDHDNTKPVVTCGTNNNVDAAENNLFSVAYANPLPSPGLDSVFVQNVDWIDGLVTTRVGTSVDYYATNTHDSIDGPVAISNDWINSSGLQTDTVYVCWYNVADATIDCKQTGSVPVAFKPTVTSNLPPISTNKTKVYPIPARNDLYIVAEASAKSYRLSDVAGHVVLQNSITNDKQHVDLKGLPKGIYMLNILNEDKSIETFKVTKE